MPYSKCPICGSVSHLNVPDPATWYRERYPDIPFGGIVPGVCFYCFGGIHIGSRVVIRSLFTEHPDWVQIGTVCPVLDIISSDDGDLFQLQFKDDKNDYFVRGEIRKPHDDE